MKEVKIDEKPKLVRKHDLNYKMLKKSDLADILTKDNSLSKEDFPSISEEVNNIVNKLDQAIFDDDRNIKQRVENVRGLYQPQVEIQHTQVYELCENGVSPKIVKDRQFPPNMKSKVIISDKHGVNKSLLKSKVATQPCKNNN